MPFVKFDVEKEMLRQCARDPKFKKIHEENQNLGNSKYELDELEELMAEFPDNPLLKDLILNEKATEELMKAMTSPRVVEYEKNNRLQEGRELLAQLSTQHNNK